MSKWRAGLAAAWLVLSVLLCFSLPAQAGQLAAFNAAVAEAYAPYRGAVSYLRTGNLDLAALELEVASARWSAVVERFAEAPPDAFADDPAWRATLEDLGERFNKSIQAIDAGDPETARGLLAPVRGTLGALRRRNNVTVFSDRIDEITAAMDRLWRFRKDPPDFAEAASLRELQSATAVLGYLLARCGREAPAQLHEREDFTRLVEGAQTAVERLWLAVEGKDEALLINTLREMRSFDRMLFLRFG
jgi:hypothetical protein